MKLYRCETKEELELKEIELILLSADEILDLAHDIKTKFDDCILEDEGIVVDALLEITKELGKRILT